MTEAPPPQLEGYRFVSRLGGGGFADVYRFEQLDPRRSVAVKALRDTQAVSRAKFRDEVGRMAALGAHPNIVTVFTSEIATDGRPCLVMEHCPRGTLADRVKAGPVPVPEVLQLGIELAGAVESVHGAGIVHRDIKPANVLINAAGDPSLTDFGISGERDGGGTGDGFSVPWAPAEAIDDEGVTDVRSDVYSLAALLWTLLSGRGPHSVGGPRDAVIGRILSGADPVPHGRADVPADLERVLVRALAKQPRARPASALALATLLQGVQRGLDLPVTNPKLILQEEAFTPAGPAGPGGSGAAEESGWADDSADAATIVRLVEVQEHGDVAEESRTVIRGVRAPGRTVQPVSSPVSWTAPRPDPVAVDRTVHRAPAPAGEDPAAAARTGPPRLVVALVAGGAALALAATGAAFALRGDPGPATDAGPAAGSGDAADSGGSGDVGAVVEVVPQVEDLTVVLGDAGAVATWTNPSPQEGDSFVWQRSEPGADGGPQFTDETTVVVSEDVTGTVCVSVALRRDDGRFSDPPAEACA